MKSWIMKRWLETHKREEYPDLSITQGNDAFHVLPESCHPPEESIERMCSKGFFSQHKYKYVEDQTLEECGNPPASSPYEEQASKPPKKKSNLSVVDENFDIHVSSDKDNDPILPDGYEVYPSFSIHNKNQTGFPMETEYESPTEKKGNQVNLKEKGETQSNQSTTELQEQEGDEEDMYGPIAPSSDLAHNGDAILEEVRKQEQNADSVNTKYPSLTIHYKEPTGVPKEPRYQPLTEHSRNQADLTEKDKTQSYQCGKTKLQHEQEGNEEVIYDFIAPSSDLGHNENVILEQVRKQEKKAVKNASVEDAEKTKYPSFTIHYKEPTGVPKEREKQRPRERRGYEGGLTERDEEQSNPPKEKSNLSVDDKNFDIPVSSDEDNDHILPEGYENNILPKGYENKMYPSFSIHNKNQTGFPMETEYQYPAENRGNQVDLKEKGETQSNRSKTELQEQEGDEEDMCGPIAPSSALGHYEKAGLEEVSKLDKTAAKNALVKDGVNTKYPSLTIHYKKPTGIPKEQGYQFPIEHRWNQADMTEKDKTQSYQCGKTKLQHEQEGNEEVIYDFIAPSSDLGHNENVILEQVRKQEEKAVKNASVEDAEKTKYPSFTIHYKEPTGVPKEREKQRPRERRGYEAVLTERGEEQSNPPKKKTKFQPRHKDDEGGINDYITISFRDSQKEQVDSNGNLEDEDEIARLGEICNQKQNVSQEETVRMTYSHEDDSGASEDVAHTLCTDNMKEEVHEAQNLQPAGEGTECKVDHQPSPFRRTSAIRRKRKSSETKKQAVPKANNKQNKENVTPEYDSQKEVLHEQDIKEVNEQHRAEEQNLSNEISPCLPLPATRGRDISMLPTRFAGIDIDLNTRIDDI